MESQGENLDRYWASREGFQVEETSQLKKTELKHEWPQLWPEDEWVMWLGILFAACKNLDLFSRLLLELKRVHWIKTNSNNQVNSYTHIKYHSVQNASKNVRPFKLQPAFTGVRTDIFQRAYSTQKVAE